MRYPELAGGVRTALGVGLLLLVLSGTGCSRPPAVGAQLLVVASIAPLGDFAHQVGGKLVQVTVILPPGINPKTYEPTPEQMRLISRARLLVLNGISLEFWADKAIAAADNSKLIVVDTSSGLKVLAGGAGEPGGNPHVWLDPLDAIVQVEHIRDGLLRADPGHASSYRANAAAYIKRLRALDQQIRTQVAGWSHWEFVALQPAWAYFARRYGLVEAGVINSSPGREPTPAELAQIIATTKKNRIKAIFAVVQFSPKAAEIIAAETGAQVVELDPLGGVPGRQSYLELMRYNLAQMERALR
ncbi:MAG TPA: zinc ABC transporter substrate-binding protein [Candidatus Fraserbacteria bacterium]|nr:zinc ABC transporter substrate-binding protein [Candidatus Fraserbacteria bacterium]